MKFIKFLLIIPLLALFNNKIFAQELPYEINSKRDISIAKITGACSIFKLMVDFQQKNKILNGDEFINKFLINEANRLNKDPSEYMSSCIQITNYYVKYLNE